MEIKGHRPHVFRFARGDAHIAHMALVDLVDRHVEADVVRARAHDVLHDGVIGISADLIVALPVAVQTQKDQICFRILGTVILTDKCNLHCKHCSVNNITAVVHPYEQIRREMQQLYDMGVRILFF